MWSRYFKKPYGKHIISLRNVLYKKRIILYERCTVPCEIHVASYKKCTVPCKKSTISYTLYRVWEVCEKCTADKIACFRVYTESQALFLHKKVHIVSTQFHFSYQKISHRMHCFQSITSHSFEIFVLLIMHKNIILSLQNYTQESWM